jgi:hypothetical protein
MSVNPFHISLIFAGKGWGCRVLIGLQSMGRFLALLAILGKGKMVMIMTNALSYYDMAKIGQ